MKFDILTLVFLCAGTGIKLACSSAVYHIASSTACPVEPCLTLSQIAADPGLISNHSDVDSDVTFLLQPGSHKLDRELAFQNFDHIGILSNDSDHSYPGPLSAIINCKWPARLEFAKVNKIDLTRVTFTGCYTEFFGFVKQLTITSCTFQNHTGSALQIQDSTVKIIETSFDSNSFGTFHYGYVSPVFRNKWVGGAITTTSSNITIINSAFVDNHAEIGGAIFGEYFSNISSINVTFEGNIANCSSRCNGGALYSEGGCNVTVVGSTFVGNVAAYGGVFAHTLTTISIHQSYFSHNEAENGGVIFVWNYYRSVKGIMSISESTFINNIAANGAVLKSLNFACTISHSYFDKNYAKNNGGVMMAFEAEYKISNCTFIHNAAYVEGGVLITKDSQIIVNKSRFIANLAQSGGCMSAQTSNVSVDKCQFVVNAATEFGGVIFFMKYSLDITDSILSHNTADEPGYGGVLYVMDGSFLTTRNMMIIKNSAAYGIIYLGQSTGHFDFNIFIGNHGPLSLYYSNVTFQGTTTFVSSASNGTVLEGGAIAAFESDVLFRGNVTIMLSNAERGGALHAIASKLYMRGNIIISNNTAAKSGGGMYLYQSEMKCIQDSNVEILGNRASEKGGGIYAIGSVLSFEYLYRNVPKIYSGSRTRFVENMAVKAGGGIYLESDTKLNILMFSGYACDNSEFVLTFLGNSATSGGAIYVADNTYPGVCASTSYKKLSTASECFLQTLVLINILFLLEPCVVIEFKHNFDHEHQLLSNVYGGLLDRCTVRYVGAIIHPYGITDHDGLSYLTSISNITDTSSIQSDVSRVCFCKDNQPDCSYQLPPVRVKKGEMFLVPLVAVDQVFRLVSATVLTSLKTNESGINEGQLIQSVREECTNLTFNVFSPHDFEELIVYARGPCMDSILSQKSIPIQFLPCKCPVGFQVRETETSRCVCDCDSRLDKYVTSCDPVTGVLLRESNFWITNINISQFSGYLIYSNCPLDYCHPPSPSVRINLSAPQGADAQCANGHSGILCGPCKPGLSLSLGNSHCIPCPSNWPLLLTASLIVASLSGILLVVVLLGLNLTVAAGTLNGIIFYANVVNSKRTTFLPFTEKRNFITVFIAWLNLDLGFDICFFEGMDAYWKTMLQLSFPSYLILLVVIIILISERSSRFARLIGRRNPVATLATLILLSYAKLLSFITIALSFAVLDYPDGSHKVVWLPQATVPYLKGKHVALFVMASIILIAGSCYTILLFSWQWLLHYQNKRVFGWVKSQTMYMFLEPYHAPYTFKHRYWTGLLLIVRAVIIITSATNASNDPGVNLLTSGVASIALLLIKGYSQGSRVYKNKAIDLLEMICYANIAILCLAGLFSLGASESRNAVAYVSGSIVFALFLLVIFRHICTEVILKSVLWRHIKERRRRPHDDSEEIVDLLSVQQEVTKSEVSPPPKDESPLTALIEAESKAEIELDHTAHEKGKSQSNDAVP